MPKYFKIITITVIAFMSSIAAASSGVTYHGRILRSDTSAVQGQFVGFRIRVMDGDTGACQMYEEIHTKDMRNSGGVFSIVVGDGSVAGTMSVTGLGQFDQLFENNKTFNYNVGHVCELTPYAAAARDGRKLNVSFRESPGDPWEDLPVMTLAYVPFAYSSLVSQKVGNHGDGSLLRVENAGTPSAVTALTPTQYTNLMTLANGASTQYVQSVLGTASQITVNTAAGVATVGLADVGTAGTYGSATQVPVFTVDAKGRVTSVTNTTITGAAPTGAAGGDLTGNFPSPDIAASAVGTAEIANLAVTDAKLAADAVTTAKILNANVTLAKLAADSVDTSKIVDGTITGSDISATAALSVASVTTTGAISSDSVSTRSIGLFELPVNGTNYVALKAPDNLAGNTTYTWPAAAPGSNMVLQSDATGVLSWVPAGSANAYVQNGNAFGAKAVLGTTDNNDLEFITNNTAKMIVKADGNVGIGTSSPSAGGTAANAARTYLTLKGSTGSGVLQMTSAAADADGVHQGGIEWVDSNSSTADKRVAYIAGLLSGTTGNNRGSYVALGTRPDGGTGAIERFKITNTGDLMVGWAGATPAARLDVHGETSDATKFAFQATNLAGTPLINVRNDGNVGIGTNAPSSKLDVKGDFAISGATSGAVKFAVPAAAGSATYTWPAAAPASNMVLQSTSAGILSWVPAATGSGDFLANGTVNMTGTLKAVGGAEALPGITFVGDVDTGIGSDSDGYMFFSSNGSSAGQISNNGLEMNRVIRAPSATSAGSPSYSFTGNPNADTGIFTPADDVIGFSTAGTERIRITAAGDVGIGKTPSAAKLDVQGVFAMSGATSGAVKFAVPAAAGSATYTWPGAAPASDMLLQSDNTGALSWLGTLPVTRGGTGATALTANRMFMANGLGTALIPDVCTIGQVLEFDGTNWTCKASSSFGSANAFVQSGNAFGAKAVLGTTDNNDLEFVTNNTAKMTVLANGNVGIGTAAPADPLVLQTAKDGRVFHLLNATTSSDQYPEMRLSHYRNFTSAGNAVISGYHARGTPAVPASVNSGMTLLSLQGRGFAEAGFGADRTGASIDFITSGNWGNSNLPTDMTFNTGVSGSWSTSEKMRITSAGNVGIGQTTPLAKLHINGTPADLPGQGYNLGNWSGTGAVVPFYARTHSHNGGSTPAAAQPAMVLAREGVSGQSWSNVAEFNLSRYENVSDNARTRLDIALNDTAAPGAKPVATFVAAHSEAALGTYPIMELKRNHNGGGGTFPQMVAFKLGRYQAPTGSSPDTRLDIALKSTVDMTPTADATIMTMQANGYVGIGTTSPRSPADINGTILTKASTLNGTSNVNFLLGNIQHTAASCGTFNLYSMKDGGSYTFVVKGGTSATCIFNAYSSADNSVPLVVHMPTDHAATVATTHTIYTFLVVDTDVYVSWIPGM